MSYLALADIAKRFRRERVLENLSLEIERGETVAVFGPSGCGKTVLLRLIAGVLAPDSGAIRIDGQPVTHLPPEQRNVGMAFQTFALYPHLVAFENIASPLRARRVSDTEIKQRVGAVAELLRISHVLDHLPVALSNGQKQRTSLARALVSGPGILLLDDPLRNVDAKLRYEMRLELPRVLREFESTVLYVTQDYKEAMALGNRIGVLYDGHFQQFATPREIYRRPANVRVARLFGDPTINLLESRIDREADGQSRLRVGGELMAAPEGFNGLPDRDCLFGVRPEDVQVHFHRVDGAIPLKLDAVTPLNLRSVMLLRMSDGTELLSSSAESQDVGRGHIRAWATVNWQRVLLFDTGTGARL